MVASPVYLSSLRGFYGCFLKFWCARERKITDGRGVSYPNGNQGTSLYEKNFASESQEGDFVSFPRLGDQHPLASVVNIMSQDLSRKEVSFSAALEEFVAKYGQSKEVYPFSLGFVVPLRTDDWHNFATDLSSPNFLTNSLRVYDFYTMYDFYKSRAFYVHALELGSDLVTLPVRVATAPFWAA